MEGGRKPAAALSKQASTTLKKVSLKLVTLLGKLKYLAGFGGACQLVHT